jgi:hypothetical protein
MSWYYAGPEAKPVGPVSLEEVHGRRLSGAIGPDTYVIEHTGTGPVGSWRRYREVFPESVLLPPLPPAVPPPLSAPVPVPAHTLFPSTGHAPQPVSAPTIAPHAAPHGHYPPRPTNAYCAWGFGLGIAGFVLSPACGTGLLLAAPALIICILGFAQVQQRRDQSGRGLAAAGAVLAVLGLLVSIGFLAYAIPAMIKVHEQAAAQQSSE